MAQRRMFSLKIIDADQFIDMPTSSRLLYYDLSMRADDDGFVSSPKKIIKMTGASEDDFKILIAKKFIIPFDDGICVIKHWKIHNYIQKDRYQETIYTDKKKQLSLGENDVYLMDTKCIQNEYTSDTQVRLGEVRIELEKELYKGEELEANASESLPHKSKPKLSELKLKPDHELTRDELILVKTDKLFTWAYDRAKINGKLPVGKSALEKWIFAGKKTARNWVEEYIDDLGKIAKIIEYCETDPYWDVNFKNLTQFNTIRTQLQEKYFKEMK